jgi:hypothetical protein
MCCVVQTRLHNVTQHLPEVNFFGKSKSQGVVALCWTEFTSIEQAILAATYLTCLNEDVAFSQVPMCIYGGII